MPEFFRRLFDSTGFPRRDADAGWSDGLVLVHRTAGVLLALALIAVPVLLLWFARRRKDLAQRHVLLLFGVGLGLAGTVFALDALAFSAPLSRLDALLRMAAAVVAWTAVFLLVPAIPRMLALRRPEDLRREVERRRSAEDDLREAHALLERRVAHRTALLASANRRLTLEVSAREQAQRRLVAKDDVTHALAESETLEEAAPRILSAVGETLGWQVGAIWMHDAEADLLRPVATWHRGDASVDDFERATRARTFRPGEGFPGHIWSQRFAAWAPDVAADPQFVRADPAAASGLHGAFGFPIVGDDRILGVVEFFDVEIKNPDQHVLDMAESLGSQIGQFVSRRRAQQELRRVASELRLVTDSLPALVSYVDAEGRYRFQNRAYRDWFGSDAELGKSLEEVFGAATYETLAPFAERALAGERVTFDARVPHRSGAPRYVQAVYVPDVAGDGRVRGFFALVTDISERKAAEEALRESEERFRAMADTAPVFIATLDVDGRVEFLNRAWLEFRGRTFEEDETDEWRDAIHPDERVLLFQAVSAAFAERRPLSVETRVRRADGEYRWILAQAVPRFTAPHRFEGYLATGIDITERRRAEQALRDGEERFRLLVESVRDYAIHGLDPHGRVTTWNAGAERIHGYRSRDILGEHVSTFFPPEAVEARVPHRLIAEAERDGSARDEGWRLRQDGTRFWGEIVLTALRDPDGHLRGFSRIVHDVTARREADEALRESESRMRLIVSTALDAVVAMDEEGRVREWNEQAERMFGWTRREAIGRLLAETIVPPRYRESHQRGLARFLSTGEGPVLNRRIEIEAVRRDGTEIPVEIAISPVRRGGRYVFSAFLRDLSDRRVLEALRRRSDDLETEKRRVEEASRLKSEFLANMSHELRTPLNSVIGFAELLHDGKAGVVSAEHREYLGDILTSARHLLQLINDVLDLAKVEAGKMALHPRGVRLPQLVAEVRDNLRGLAAQKRISVALDVHGGPEEVVADASRIQQILYNYLSNALKFTPEGGHVVVRLAPEGKDAFRLEVVDDGPGISKEDQHRLFVEFQQLDEGAAKRYPGTGLGLALTRRLAEAQGGRVGVVSERNRGSTFFAVLPRTPPSEKSLASAPRGRDVLVVAGSAPERARIAASLAEAGYEADAAASGAEAAMRCRDRAYAVVAVGGLPPGAGSDAVREIRATDRNRTTPVLAVVSRADGSVSAIPVERWLSAPAAVLEPSLAASLETASGRSGKIVVVGQDAASTEPMERALAGLGRSFRTALGPDEAGELAAGESPSAVVLCASLDRPEAFDLVDGVRALAGAGAPVVLWEPPIPSAPHGPPRSPRSPAPPRPAVAEPAEGLLEAVAACVSRGADGVRAAPGVPDAR